MDAGPTGAVCGSRGRPSGMPGKRERAECGCLARELPPPPPRKEDCPVPLTSLNAAEVTAWLKEYYASSTFNVCKHQPLPMMRGAEPMRIYLKDDAVPVAVHRPSPIPAHWQQKVKDDIERDIRLGVLEHVPLNTPVTWCSRMHIVAKKNGEPRRVVDLRPVNAASKRQTHYVEPPYSQARSIPPNHLGGLVMRGTATTRCH